ncbi:MAG: hypothetical protein AABO41_00100 [Acidobacteriota bacterium]
MQTAANIGRSITDSCTSRLFADPEGIFRFGGLYHQRAAGLVRAIHTTETARRLATELVSTAEQAYARRQLDIVRLAGLALMDLPLAHEYRSVGLFYQTLGMSGGTENAIKARLFERLADEASGRYRVKALLALGAGSITSSDRKAALFFLQEAMQLMTRDKAADLVTALWVNKGTAVVTGNHGDHQGALAGLQALYPLARTAGRMDAVAYPDYLNSLAVELGEVGRLEEARRVSQMILASPLAPAYPEWTETLADIEVKLRGASRSIVTVPPVPRAPSLPSDSLARIVSWPGDYPQQVEATPIAANHSASIVSLHDWKRRTESQSKGGTFKKPTAEEIRSMDFTEKQATITRSVYAEEVNEDLLDSILKVVCEPDTGDGASA